MPIKALIFDFDGLIIDSESPVFEVWRDTFAKHGRELRIEFWSQLVGRPHTYLDFYSYFREHINPDADIEKMRVQQRNRVTALTERQPVLPGVKEYLQGASELGMKIGLASSSSRHHVHGHLARLGLLDYFHATKCFEDTSTHKPNPSPYLAVLDELGVGPGEAIAFEDSPNGVTSAKAAGIFCVAVPNPITERLPLDHADHRLASMAAEPLGVLLRRAVDRR